MESIRQKIKDVFDKWDRGQIREIKISNLKLTVNVGEDIFENKWTQIYFEKDGKNLGMIFKLSDKKTNTVYSAESFDDKYNKEFEEAIIRASKRVLSTSLVC